MRLVSTEQVRSAADALARGDAITALQCTQDHKDPRAQAIRGVAYAQLQEYELAQKHLKAAIERSSTPALALTRARALAALAEIQAAQRAFEPAASGLTEAADILRALGDHRNAAWAGLVRSRLLLLNADEAGAADARREAAQDAQRSEAPALQSMLLLARAEAAVRNLSIRKAVELLERALHLLDSNTTISALAGEVRRQHEALTQEPIATWISEGSTTLTALQVEARLSSARASIIVDRFRSRLTADDQTIELRGRPLLFSLLLQLAKAWPKHALKDALIRETFETNVINDSHRVRLRVELGRLRKLIGAHTQVEAHEDGWRLQPFKDRAVCVLEPIAIYPSPALVALLADKAAWSAADIGRALGKSKRTIQRLLNDMKARHEVQVIGQGAAQRYVLMTPGDRLATQMLLLGLFEAQ